MPRNHRMGMIVGVGIGVGVGVGVGSGWRQERNWGGDDGRVRGG